MPGLDDRIVVTGAAGLVGLNLVTLLVEAGHTQVVALDRNRENLDVLRRLHPSVRAIDADLALPGAWEQEFDGAALVFQLHAQIASKSDSDFVRNNVDATRLVLAATRRTAVPFLIHVSSSVVNSVADDAYVRTKRIQEDMVRESGLPHCVLRPTLMFGWFDGKHLGWLARFMERTPIFPVPGHGRYARQPLYNRDLCRALLACADKRPDGAVYDLTGPDRIDYIDIIRAIRDVKGLRTRVVPIPYSLFAVLLGVYGLFSRKPPFTVAQLRALVAGDEFSGVDLRETFGVTPTPFVDAVRETFGHPVYSSIVLGSPH